MKRFAPHIAAAFLLSLMVVPHFVHALDLKLIICDPAPSAGSSLKPCGFNDLVTLVNNLINDLIILSTILVTAALMFTGAQLLTSGGSAGARTKARDTAWTIVKGYLWILSAWLLVYTFTHVLLNDGYSILTKPTS
jgi:hypothetical protein